MIVLPLVLAIAVPLVAIVVALLIGYAFGTTRFLGRLNAEVERAGADAWNRAVKATKPGTSPPVAGAPIDPSRVLAGDQAIARVADLEHQLATRPRMPALSTRVHAVLLDGISNSGKSTLIHRLAFPCTDRAALLTMKATPLLLRNRTLPICLEPAGGDPPELLHTMQLNDVSGERPQQLANAIDELLRERGAPRAGETSGKTIALWVWDMANVPGCRTEMNLRRMQTVYAPLRARELISAVVVFLNKIDLLQVDPPQLATMLHDEEQYLRGVASTCFDASVPVTFATGSALTGEGVTDCQGALYDAFGLGRLFRATTGDGTGGAP